MMDTKLIITSDGSHTILNSEIDESYHSENGAINESLHVYIQYGLSQISKADINILEIGFGTGLNALLSYRYAQEHKQKVNYFTIEKYPISFETAVELNYSTKLNMEKEAFLKLHQCDWNSWQTLNNSFSIFKKHINLTKFDFTSLKDIDLVYFDAFSPSKQLELWSEEIFKQINRIMVPNGLLTTYSSAGIVKRALRASGYTVKRKPGPKGKFHMLNAFKMDND